MNNGPLVSVILPVFNAEEYVQEAIESILTQYYKHFELIVINDGSTDNSASIIKELSEQDPRIVVISRPNEGLVSALNTGLNYANGEFIARMDADDKSMSDRFTKQVEYLLKNPRVAVVGTFIKIIDEHGAFIRNGEYPTESDAIEQFLEFGCPMAHPSVMMRREVVKFVGGYRKAFSHCEDYDLWLRISEEGFHLANIPEPLLAYRNHSSNISLIQREKQELGSIVARITHRARVTGVSDPFDFTEEIDIDFVEMLPDNLRFDAEAEIFTHRFLNTDLNDKSMVKMVWDQYQSLSPVVKRKNTMTKFVLRLIVSAAQVRAPRALLKAIIELVMRHPVYFSRQLILRLFTGEKS